jgi:hypothetical protein
VWSARLAADGMTLAASVRCSVMANAAEWHVLALAAQRRAKVPSVEQVALALTVRETAMVRQNNFTRHFFRYTLTSLAVFHPFVAPLRCAYCLPTTILPVGVIYPCALFLLNTHHQRLLTSVST